MRIEPNNNIKDAAGRQLQVENVMRIIAIIISGISVFIFFIKLLFL